MMGWGTMGSGAGGNSLSTSNLSALAPPFTVGRLNPKPSTNPLLHYTEPPYLAEPFTQPWQYARPSAPEPEIDSTGMTSVPVTDDYRFSASASFIPSSTQWSAVSSSTKATGSVFAYGSEVEPYYSPYVPTLVGEDSLFIADEGSRYDVVPTSGLGGTSQLDYSKSLVDLECGPQWVGSLGFDDGKQAKISELDGSFSSEKANSGGSHSYINQLYQGWHGSENRNKSKEDSVFSYQSFNHIFDGESCTGLAIAEHMEDKPCLEQSVGFLPYNSNTTPISTSCSSYPESYPKIISREMQMNSPNHQKSFNPYEKCVRPIHTPFLGRASVTMASPTLVIRPPPTPYGNSGQSIASCKPACSENVGNVHNVNFDFINPSKLNNSGLPSSCKNKEASLQTNLFNFSEQGTDLVSSTSLKELLNPLHSKDTSDRNVKARFGSRLPDINVSSGFIVAGENDSFDNVDHHNYAVDSPCWKGAPSSQFPKFDIESGNSNLAKVNLDELYGLRLEEHKILPSMANSDRVFSEKVGGTMGKGNECARNCVAFDLERTLSAISSTKEQTLLDGGKNDTLWTSPKNRSKVVELIDGSNMLNRELNLLKDLTSVFDFKVSDHKHSDGEGGGGMALTDVPDGAAIAVCAAEKVLASPASQEDATECSLAPDSKLDVQAMIKAIHNLSEVLRVHLSSDACSLDENNIGVLKRVIRNLDSCLSKNVVQATSKLEPNNNPVGDTPQIFGVSRDVGKISEDPSMKSEAANSDIKLGYLDTHEAERNYSFPGKKDENSLNFTPLRDDLDITGDDNMTKAIKKVLEENFQLNEEMPSQVRLFKNLWLQTEAKLCSISFKARFDRIKIQMEEIRCNATREIEDIAEITSQIFISHDPITTSELAHKAHHGTSLDPTSPNGDDVEASVLARFNILKSREEKVKAIDMEEEQQPAIVDGVEASSSSIMSRLDILKSRDGIEESISLDKEKQLKMIDGDADSIMSQFSILKSREETPKSFGVDDKKQPKMIDGKNLHPLMRGELEDETFIVAQKPRLLLQRTGNLNDGKMDSYGDAFGYESLNDFYLTNDPIIRSFKSSITINENSCGSHDSSSSDWEHVLKEDVSWKNI